MTQWINVTGRPKGEKFKCPKCGGTCICIAYGNTDRHRKVNICDYEYCPRCGRKIIMSGGKADEIEKDSKTHENN